MPRIGKGKIIWDEADWLGGLDQSSAGVFDKKGVGIANAQRIDPLRILGYIAPGFDATNLTNSASVTGYLLNGVVNGNAAFCTSDDGMIHSITGLNVGTISTTAPYPHTISGATNAQDICVYYVNISSVRTKRIFYSWKNGSSSADIGVIIPGAPDTFTDAWLSTVPTNAAALDTTSDHPLVVGDDDILYIGDGNNVHAMDGATGANGTLSKKVFTLPVGWIITSFAKTNDQKLAISAYYTSSASGSTFNSGEAKIFMWDYLSLDPTSIYNLNDNYVSEVLNWRGTLIAFTQGRQNFSEPNINKLQILSGGRFEVLKTWTYGTVPRRGGVEIVNDDLIWNASGRVYTFSKIPETSRYILNSPFGNSTGSDSCGMLKIFSNSLNVIMSSGTTDLKAAVRLPQGTFHNNVAILDLKTAYPENAPGARGRITRVTVKFRDATTDVNGLQFSLTLIADKVNDNFVINAQPVLKEQNLYYAHADGTPFNSFTSLGLEAEWAGGGGIDRTKCPVLESIVVDYEEIVL